MSISVWREQQCMRLNEQLTGSTEHKLQCLKEWFFYLNCVMHERY